MRRGETPLLAWGDFHARSRFARSTIPEEKWETTRSKLVGWLFPIRLLGGQWDDLLVAIMLAKQ